jgi:two-component system, OmpR family, phosphate regulon sensor histidine kinase PhoR
VIRRSRVQPGKATGSRRLWSATSGHLTLLLLAVVIPPAATLIWLGVQLFEQDRAAVAQREAERRTALAQTVALELRQRLSGVERLVDEGQVPAGIIRLVLSGDYVDISPPSEPLWTPTPQALRPAGEGPFIEATTREYQGDVAGALAIYQRLAQSQDEPTRVGALRRLARVHRRAHRWDEALAAYREMETVRGVEDLGMPAGLLARRQVCEVLDAAGRSVDLAAEAARLERDLLSSAWSIDRVAWELTVLDLERWRGSAPTTPVARALASALAEMLWQEYRDNGPGTFGSSASRVVDVDGTAVTVLFRPLAADVTVVALPPIVLDEWAASAVSGAASAGAQLALIAPTGRTVTGAPPRAGTSVVRLAAADTGLPWELSLWSERGSSSEELAARRRLLAIGLASILLLLAGGSYFLWRVVQRELAVGRLQTEFVSAVSHEFRTPLTSLRHVTELLEEDDAMPPERRRAFYDVYRRNTERLHQLVESLLDFARMEAGRRPYDLRPIEAGPLAAEVVAEFRRQRGAAAGGIELDIASAGGLHLAADRSALGNALWNLLDNAVKYSPEGSPIRVSVGPCPWGVAITVQDNGLGIARQEREAIFQRFVRGTEAVQLGIKGTGLGLALVAHIARAHGGDIEVESERGKGSTFRLVLPGSVAAHQVPLESA